LKIKIKLMKLEPTKKDLVKVLNSYLLYDEFFYYCEKKCCSEYLVRKNALFSLNILLYKYNIIKLFI